MTQPVDCPGTGRSHVIAGGNESQQSLSRPTVSPLSVGAQPVEDDAEHADEADGGEPEAEPEPEPRLLVLALGESVAQPEGGLDLVELRLGQSRDDHPDDEGEA